MQVPIVDLKSQYEELKNDIDKAVIEVLSSGMYAPSQNVQLLEQEIAASCNVKFGIALNSGTDAIKIGLQAMGVKEGDEVITTPFTFGATVEAIVQNNAKPVFIDIEPKTFNMDVEQLESAITERTKVILPVHLFGQIADMEKIRKIADQYHLLVLEDAAQAIGSTRNDLPIANLGDAAALSFYPTKNLGAAGDGGMLLTNDEKFAEVSKSLRQHGMGKKNYYYEEIGHTSRLDEIQAAILRIKFRKLGQWNQLRRVHAKIYDEAFSHSEIMTPYVDPATSYHTYHQYTIKHNNRDAFANYLKEHQVSSAVYYPEPMHTQVAYQYLGYKKGDFPVSEKICEQVLSLPIHAHLSTEQVEYAAKVALHFNAGQTLTGV